ncbi:MAG: hypothetical protein K9J21_07115 [Bacteroidales bacterium]|nr:hypothetical protein [Bacteroidales bacterium]
MSNLSEKERQVLEKFLKYVYTNDFSNEFLVQLIELAGSFLNLQTIPDYARENNLSYNGVKKTRQIRKIFNVKFVIDNN